jgi:hypothetical protein
MELPTWADLRGKYREALTSAAYLGLLVIALQWRGATGRVFCLGLLVGVGFLAWASTYRRARAMADIATSRIGSAAQGYVEVVGRASVAPHELIASPISGLACIWFRYRIYTRDNSGDEWTLTDSGTSSATFEISDGSGACRVDPDHAEVISPERRVTHAAGEKRVEELLFGGCQIYVLGDFSTSGGASTTLDLREDVGALLAEWKKDPVALRRRFDLDGNGEIDLHEWELARRLATKAVEQQHRELRNQGDLHVMRAPRDGRLFLISPLPPQRVRQRYLWWSFAHLGAALLGLALLVGWGRPGGL